MNKALKKLLAVGLSVILIISLIPTSVFTALAYDSVEEFADSPAITLDTETGVSYDGNEVSGTFKFTPAADGLYLFYSSGSTDTYVQIVDSNGYNVASDDDSGEGSNFKVRFQAKADETYYLLSRPYYSSNTADYTVTLTEYTNPIERVEVAPIQVIKDLNGDIYTDANDNEYFHYEYSNPTYTVYFKDGSSPRTSSYGMSIDGQYFYLEYQDDQDTNHWTDLGDYDVDFTFAGISSTFTVSVIENPVDHVEVENIKVIDGQNVYSSYDYNTGEPFNRYEYSTPDYTVYFKDGTQSETDCYEKYILDEFYQIQYSDNQSNEHWTLGNTYTVPCKFMGIDCSFDVTVVPTPVTSVVIDDIVLTENINGYKTTDSNGDEYYYFYLGNTPDYTVYYDGTHTAKNRYNKQIYNGSYGLVYNIDQDEQHFLPGQTYVIPCTFCGFECSFNVIVNESPISDVVIDDIVLIEGFGGQKMKDDDGRPYYYYYFSSPKYTVYFKDGTQSQKTTYGTEITPGNYEYLNYNIDQYTNHLKFGDNVFTAKFAGKEYEFKIRVIKNPVESIEFEEITVYENMGGYITTDADGEEYYHYNYNAPSFTLYFDDGTVSETNPYGKEVNGTTYYLEIGDDYQEDEHWTAGDTYDVDFTFMDIEGTFSVTVEPNPVSSVEIDDVVLLANQNGYTTTDHEGNEYFYYYLSAPQYVVNFSNGEQSEKTNGDVEINGTYYYLNYNSYQYQYQNHFEVGHTYQIPCTFAGIDCSFNVIVKATPITSIVFDAVSVTENVDGYTEYDADDNEYFRYSYNSPKYIAYFEDGTNTGKISGSVYYNGRYYYTSYYDDQYENHWTVGNTYQVPFSVLGYETSFSVEVKKSPIVSVVVDKTVILENTSGYTDTDSDGNEYFRYSYHPQYVVNLDNGQTTTKTGYSTQIGNRYYNLEYDDKQYEYHWEVGNTYSVPFVFMGYRGTFEVEIKESPVESVVIEPTEVIENITGYWDSDNDGNEFFCYYFSPEYTVYFKDGTHTATNSYNKTINGISMGLTVYDDQYSDHWTLGNTYNVTFEFMGIETTAPVTVVENPVQSVSINGISIIENTNGRFLTDSNGEQYFDYYSYNINPQFTVTFKNGTTTGLISGSYQLGDTWYSLEFDVDQSETHWTVGNTYTVPCTFLGIESSFTVSIIPNPIARITVEDVTVIENGLGYYSTDSSGTGFFYYSNFNPIFNVYFTDGTYSLNNTGSMRIGGTWFSFGYNTDQYRNHWTVGNTYTADYSFMGFTGTFNVTITENPIASIVPDAMSIIENSNGYFRTDYNTGERYFEYRYYPTVTVNYKDGTSVSEVSGSVKIGDTWYSLQTADLQDDVHWAVGGTYVATASIAGVEADFDVTVVPSPVERIEVQNVTLVENSIGWVTTDNNSIEFFHYSYDPNFKVYFKDGTQTEMSSDSILIGGRYYALSDFEDNQYDEHWTVGGTYDVSCQFLGAVGSFTVTVVESPVSRIEVDDIIIIDKIGCWLTSNEYGIEYLRYPYNCPPFTVYFKNGTKTEKNANAKVINGQRYWLDWSDTQDQQPWSVGGTYAVDCEFLGAKSTFNVTVKPISYFASSIPTLTLNTPKAMSYNGSVLSGLTRFTPTADGNYTFYTTGKLLTDGSLYDADGNMVAYDYGDEYDYNYRIETTLKGGSTYYLLSESMAMGIDDPSNSVFTVTVTGSEGPVGCTHGSIETRGAREATCTESGYSGDIYCTICGEKIASGVVLAALGHTGGTATCHSKAVCTRCRVEYGEFNPYNHDGETEIRGAVAATGTTDGYTGDTYCLGCGQKIADGKIIPADTQECQHSRTEIRNASAATCTVNGYTGDTYCLDCGEKIRDGEVIVATGHTLGEWLSDENDHWHVCESCTAKLDIAAHTASDWIIDVEATAEAAGHQYKECTVCGRVLEEEEISQLATHIPGDINGDGNVNNKDLTRLFQYLSDWDVEVNEAALDVNGDGSVNNKDLTRLFQYLSDWDVEIF